VSSAPPPSSAGRRSVGVRAKILAVGAVGVVAALVVGVLAFSSLGHSRNTSDRVQTLNGLLGDVQDIEFRNADIGAWQTAYGWDADKIGPVAAVADASPNRAGYLDSADRLRSQLQDIPTALLTAHERALFDKIRQDWQGFFANDDQVVALFRQNTPASAAAAGELIVGKGFEIFFDISDLTTQLRSSVSDRVAAAAQTETRMQTRDRVLMAVVIAVAVPLVIGAALWVARRIVRPLNAVRELATALAAGDLSRSSGVDSGDEVGLMASALDTAVGELRSVLSSVVSSADAVAASSEELSASSAQISASAEETSAQSGVVSSAAEEVSRSVETVAAGAEQMGASIREIASNAAEASEVAARAVTAAETTTATVAKLGDSSAEIGNVVKVITSIAEQTNLLALNATIEAARAGEAGKGFAVVANEVKELAQETAKATEDIARRVQAIQADTGAAVTAIGEISSIVAQISDRQTTIASAVEEQTATTNEMSRSVQEAAGGTGQIATNITSVSAAADSTTQALTQTRTAVDELSRMAADLRSTVGRFTY
jgi:methyl-accepting chemotaxis protein